MFLTTISVKNETWVCNTNKDYEIRGLEDFFTKNTKKWAYAWKKGVREPFLKITSDPKSQEEVCFTTRFQINFCPSLTSNFKNSFVQT